jgi:hypothetical protein|tara:strand:- start:83 stop:205 length:123 start_codon:yes stop_codon:yes gene_type:complete
MIIFTFALFIEVVVKAISIAIFIRVLNATKLEQHPCSSFD